MGINYLNSPDTLGVSDVELELLELQEGFGNNPFAHKPEYFNKPEELQRALDGLATIRYFDINSANFKPKFQFKANPYASLPDFKATQILAKKQEENLLHQPLVQDDSNIIIETEQGKMTKHAQLVENARKYYEENRYDIDEAYLNIDGSFKGILLNTMTGDIALDLPHLRDQEQFIPFTINDIVEPHTQNAGILSHTTTEENAKNIRANGFNQKLAKADSMIVDGVHFIQGENAPFGSLEGKEIVHARYNGSLCEANLNQLNQLTKKLQQAHEDEFEGLNDGSDRLSKVFLQNLMSEIGYDGIIADDKDGSKEVIAFDSSKIILD